MLEWFYGRKRERNEIGKKGWGWGVGGFLFTIGTQLYYHHLTFFLKKKKHTPFKKGYFKHSLKI